MISRGVDMTDTGHIGVKSYKSGSEKETEKKLVEYLKVCPIPEDQLLENLGLFLTPKNFSRMLFMHHIYQNIVPIPGVIMDFGTRWGHNLALFSCFRGMYEPFNRHRKVIGFDTFSGFPEITSEDGASDLMVPGNVSVSPNYREYLGGLMSLNERMSPLSHITKYEIVVGDATETVPQYLSHNPETIVALAYFDFDLYKPTKIVLEAIKDRLVQGSVIGFDELNDHDSPGETLALKEVFGLGNVKLQRLPFASRASFLVVA